MMFTRLKRKELQNALLRSPAVVLLGPRQVGKTTLALDVALPDGGYLDLESPEDRNKLSRKLTQMVNKLKIETSISLRMRDEEVEIHGKSNCWDIGRR
jgi:predicted AAA+ superfamily ATPase